MIVRAAEVVVPSRSLAGGERVTIGAEKSLAGIGLHLGAPCTLTFRPALSGSGVFFRRDDRPGSATIPARADVAVEAERRTQLGRGDDALHTVEHV
ncbi:MAG: UDP-3-O-acyl-N-acetylglucosamine deacetylase, partial [Gemmatimonadaceae bacterium]